MKQLEIAMNESDMVASGTSVGKLSLVAASVFIVGELAGSGVLALPSAVASSGWWGVLSIVICCIATGIAAIYLGRCWMIIETRYPEYRKNCGHPYSIIGLKAYGSKMSTIVTINVLTQLFGVSVVFLILTSNLFYDILKSQQIPYLSSMTSCQWIIFAGLIACPFMWLPSPAEITFIAYTAMSCTAVSCLLLLIIYAQQDWTSLPTPEPIKFEPFCLSLGTIAFAFGGTATFPTFQNFMKNRHHFPYAVTISFIMMLVIYLPVAVGGFVLYANGVKDNILDNLPDCGLKTAVNLLMAFHVFAALLIVINPVNMGIEQFLHMPCGKLSLSKCILRTVVCLAMIFVGLSIPKFGKIVNLVGAIAVSTTSFMFPPLFYLRLERSASGGTQVVCYSIAAIGLVGGVVAMYSAVKDIFDAFDKPCYA